MTQTDDLLSKHILSRDGDNCDIGNVLSPHDVRLMKEVNLWNKEGNILLLMRYSVLRVASRTSPHTRLSWGRCIGNFTKNKTGTGPPVVTEEME
jgi:hypothetical protein